MSIFTEKVFTTEEKIEPINYLYENKHIGEQQKDLLIKLNS